MRKLSCTTAQAKATAGPFTVSPKMESRVGGNQGAGGKEGGDGCLITTAPVWDGESVLGMGGGDSYTHTP